MLSRNQETQLGKSNSVRNYFQALECCFFLSRRQFLAALNLKILAFFSLLQNITGVTIKIDSFSSNSRDNNSRYGYIVPLYSEPCEKSERQLKEFKKQLPFRQVRILHQKLIEIIFAILKTISQFFFIYFLPVRR